VGSRAGLARSSPAWRLLRGALALFTVASVAFALTFLVLDAAASSAGTTLVSVMFLAVPATFAVVGGLLSVRRPENTVGWMCLTIGLVWGIQSAGDAITVWAIHRDHLGLVEWAGLSEALWLPAVGLTGQLALRLPDGRLPSERWRLFSWFCTGSVVLVTVVLLTKPGRVNDVPGTINPVGSAWLHALSPLFVLIPISFLGAFLSLALRYRRSDGLARLQIRWIAFGGLVIVAVGLPLLVATLLGHLGTGLPVPVQAVDIVANLAIPITIGVAVLRYRLYEIDTIINRTLVYAGLTAVLVATYLVSVLAFRLVLDPITGKSDLAVAVSTLAVAALFRPLRSRIQRLVDHRFYRRKYDAARTLESFVARLREEVDLETVGLDLRAVVNETMQPEHVRLWLQRGA
jgi:hypothetical protein